MANTIRSTQFPMPLLQVPWVDIKTGIITKPWSDWLIKGLYTKTANLSPDSINSNNETSGVDLQARSSIDEILGKSDATGVSIQQVDDALSSLKVDYIRLHAIISDMLQNMQQCTSDISNASLVHTFNDEYVRGLKHFLDGSVHGGLTNNSKFETDGTLKFNGNATVYNDIVFPLRDRTTGGGRPVFATFLGDITAPRFAVNDYMEVDASEFPHDWEEGTNLSVHVHWTSMTNVAATRGVKWEVQWAYVPDSYGTTQWTNNTMTAEETVPANTPAYTEFLTVTGTISPTTSKIGGQIRLRLKRIAASGTAPATDPFATAVGIHISCDTCGSRTISAK